MATGDASDLRHTIVPKSDQLNAEQLIGGPQTVTVTDVHLSDGPQQPVVVHWEGENGRPYKPCLTMRRLLIFAWGNDGREWVGRSMTLYCDPAVRFGGEKVGGIRISAMTDIPARIELALSEAKGKRAKVVAVPLELVPPTIAAAPTVAALKSAFRDAWRAAGEDEGLRAHLTAAKDARLAELAAGGASAAIAGAAAPPPPAPAAAPAPAADASSAPPPPAFTPSAPAPANPVLVLDRYMRRINTAADRDAADVALDEARHELAPADLAVLSAAADAKFPPP